MKKIKVGGVEVEIRIQTSGVDYMYAICEDCKWKGAYKEIVALSRDLCPDCHGDNIGVFEECPKCKSPDKTEGQAGYLLSDEVLPCPGCQVLLGIREKIDQF